MLLQDLHEFFRNGWRLSDLYEYQLNKLTKEFLNDFWSYAFGPFIKELLGPQISQFRTIPIEGDDIDEKKDHWTNTYQVPVENDLLFASYDDDNFAEAVVERLIYWYKVEPHEIEGLIPLLNRHLA